jgi:hypothetical protein
MINDVRAAIKIRMHEPLRASIERAHVTIGQ